MMYPFLSAILPVITPAAVPEMSLEEFDELAQEQLSEKDFRKLIAADAPDAGNLLPVYQEMKCFKECLNYRIAAMRAEKLKTNEHFEVPGEIYGEIDFALASAVSASPLEREKIIDAACWRKLDELEISHEMDLIHFCVYRMKLAMLQKYSKRDGDAGCKNFEAALEKLAANFNEP
ncbi:MAG: hypothetical protein IKD23_01690 [Lentisphaeria bacterium]|nr:hypothetical protein [Lentisphaeria bacterium]